MRRINRSLAVLGHPAANLPLPGKRDWQNGLAILNGLIGMAELDKFALERDGLARVQSAKSDANSNE